MQQSENSNNATHNAEFLNFYSQASTNEKYLMGQLNKRLNEQDGNIQSLSDQLKSINESLQNLRESPLRKKAKRGNHSPKTNNPITDSASNSIAPTISTSSILLTNLVDEAEKMEEEESNETKLQKRIEGSITDHFNWYYSISTKSTEVSHNKAQQIYKKSKEVSVELESIVNRVVYNLHSEVLPLCEKVVSEEVRLASKVLEISGYSIEVHKRRPHNKREALIGIGGIEAWNTLASESGRSVYELEELANWYVNTRMESQRAKVEGKPTVTQNVSSSNEGSTIDNMA